MNIITIKTLALTFLATLAPSSLYATTPYSNASLSTPDWVTYTVGSFLVVLSSGITAHVLLTGLKSLRILGPDQVRAARDRVRLLFGGLVMIACLFPFLATHAPSLTPILIIVVALSGVIYREREVLESQEA